ncbi:tryptophan--tRNA ligase [Fluviispira sanaruensis]|uniref:Tryptophan--tRNA ligase n=1 Tax=Fluviispira sanaruensis TaxID=2493639 RepID=A0A4P2VK18_FLUSA|nr:tryptophan--tRNA ligase [Fluviispira sanaruensis]BBH53603.1 tryptophan--tRNA ligase [Fluviispira sanaruensis]
MKESTQITKNKPTQKTLESRKRFLTGIKATGQIHLGNYFGAIKPMMELSQNSENEVILMCVDWHGLTNRAKIMAPGELSHSIIALYLALGFNLNGNSILLQSDFPQIHENAWYLSCSTASGLLERSHAYKDALANGKEASAGLLYYPVLMASDIVTFDSQYIPVGKDQNQHLEYASDMAKLFNNLVATDVYIEAKGVEREIPTLIGTDGDRKMSKSYNNEIPIFAAKKDIEKKVKEIKTDSKGLDEPKDPNTCTIFQIFQSFASKDAISYMRERLEKGTGYGYGHAKKDFVDEHERVFGVFREKYDYYLNNEKVVKDLLEPGYERANNYANAVLERARTALGLKSYNRIK